MTTPNAPPKRERIEAVESFWVEFASKEAAIRELYLLAPIESFFVVESMVKTICSELTCEIGPGVTSPFSLSISPGGDEKLLLLAKYVIVRSPTLNQWEFYPAKLRKERSELIFHNGSADEVYSFSDIHFAAFPWLGSSKAEVLLISSSAPDDERRARTVAFAILDSLLGEEIVIGCIARVEFRSDSGRNDLDLRPLMELEALLKSARVGLFNS